MLKKGVFWIVDEKLMSFPYDGDSIGAAKYGDTYNHRKLWPHVKPEKCDKPYNYYPRGRVDILNKGQPVIWLSPHIEEKWIGQIKTDFGITGDADVRYDYSRHYMCYLDGEKQKKYIV